MLATKGTLESELFHQSVIEHGGGIDIVPQIGKGLVACVEAGKREDQTTKELLKSHLAPMIDKRNRYLGFRLHSLSFFNQYH